MFFGNHCLFDNWVINLYKLIIYSQKSFNSIDTWLKELTSNSNPDVKIFLVGNKLDLEDDRTVTTEEAENLVNDLEFDYFIETSAKTGINAEALFVQAAKLLYTEYKELQKTEPEQKSDTKKLDNINNIIKKKKKCC